MKIGIVTIQDNFNYGNRLQNYAVSKIVESYKMQVDTVIIKNREELLQIDNYKKWIKRILPNKVNWMLSAFKKQLVGNKLEISREKSFQQFNQKYIRSKTYYIDTYAQLLEMKQLQNYDYFLAGSDQIWNPFFAGQELYFLTFAPPQKRIAFIASIGVSKLPKEEENRYKEYLSQMKYISVREESAVKIISELIDKQADCFLDPVLLIKREEWLKLMEPVVQEIPSQYILSFFLGEKPEKEIELFANSKHLPIIHMNNKAYKKFYCLNPAQLLYLINHAEFVLTDSFHVTAFSIIFQKQFYVFKRKQIGMENLFSRMETLLGKLDLYSRVQDTAEIKDKEKITKEKYEKIEECLVEEKVKFDKILKNVLS